MRALIDKDAHRALGCSERTRMALREEVRNFCETLSIKGVPRVMQSEGASLKAFWILSVLTLFCVAGYQAYQLISSYLEFAVVTSFYEKPFHPMTFIPSIPITTICNENPIVQLRGSNLSLISTRRLMSASRATITAPSNRPSVVNQRPGP